MRLLKINVIIVTFNGMKWIDECLKSILDSSIPVSIIIVDNCSTDGTADYINMNFPEVILLKQNLNMGFGKANNIGISFALNQKTDFVFLLNQDAFVAKNTIQILADLLEQNPEYGILSPIHTNRNEKELDESFLYYIKNSFSPEFISDFVLNNSKKSIYNLPMINAAAWMLPKSTLELIGGFDPMFFLYGEDDNYCQRILYHKLLVGITPLTIIRHDSANNNTKSIIIGSEKYYDKFLNNIKVVYGNVNSDKYKELKKLKYFFFKQSLFSFIKLDFENFKIYWKKRSLLGILNLEKSVVLNRKKGRTHL